MLSFLNLKTKLVKDNKNKGEEYALFELSLGLFNQSIQLCFLGMKIFTH